MSMLPLRFRCFSGHDNVHRRHCIIGHAVVLCAVMTCMTKAAAIAQPDEAITAAEAQPAASARGPEGGDVRGDAGPDSERTLDPERTLAVLSYRSGVADLADIDLQLANLLRQKTALKVLDSQDARRRYGERLDRRVVNCGGDAGCIAKLGRALQVDEVLLVGVSRFGDIILTLQRIDASTGDVSIRIAEALEPNVAPEAAVLLSYLRRVMPKRDFVRYGFIRLDANIAGAEVFISGKVRGRTPLPSLRVPAPGTYHIRLTKPGYIPADASVFVPPDSKVEVDLSLPVIEKRPWYRNVWFAAATGVVIAATAATILVIVLDEPDDHPVIINPP